LHVDVFLLCAGLLVLLYAGLSNNVSRLRLRQQKLSDVTEAELTKAIRAHGNASEYVPLFVVLFLYLQLTQASAAFAIVAVVATLSRIAHAAGMLRIANVADRHPLRFLGALGTYLCLFAFGGQLLFRAF
jgi:uncharacterized membrane protein YecN with MAPEG domain